MTQAFNLSQLANKVNTSGQLDGSTGISGTIPNSNLPTVDIAHGGTGLTSIGAANTILTSNGTSASWAVAPAGGFTNIQVFTSSGAFTTPASTTKVRVTVVGGGGNGGSGYQNPTPIASQGAFGGGGGGGGYAVGIYSVSASTPYPVTVGGATQTSSFSTLISATGGASGSTASAGGGGSGIAPTGVTVAGEVGTSGGVQTIGIGGVCGGGLGNVTTRSNRQPNSSTGVGGNGGGPGSGPSAPSGAGSAGIVIVEY